MNTATISPVTIKLDLETKEREAFHQDAINAWQEYQETSLHVTEDEQRNSKRERNT